MKIRGGCIFLPRYTRQDKDGQKQTRKGQTYIMQYRVNGRIQRESTGTKDAQRARQILLRKMAEV